MKLRLVFLALVTVCCVFQLHAQNKDKLCADLDKTIAEIKTQFELTKGPVIDSTKDSVTWACNYNLSGAANSIIIRHFSFPFYRGTIQRAAAAADLKKKYQEFVKRYDACAKSGGYTRSTVANLDKSLSAFETITYVVPEDSEGNTVTISLMVDKTGDGFVLYVDVMMI